MPTYDYKCLKCNYAFEEFQKMTDDPLSKCPKCKGKVKRLIGAGLGPIFKGSGFYQTDYKNPSSKSSKTETKKTEAKSTDSKSEKKSVKK